MRSKHRNLLFVLTFGLIFIAAYAYGASRLNVGNTGNITLLNNNLFADTTNITGLSTCSTLPSTSYSDAGLSVIWPSIAQGTSGSVYVCLKNTGSVADPLNFIPGTLPIGVSFTSPQQGAGLPSLGTVLCRLTLTATTTATAGGFSFILTVT